MRPEGHARLKWIEQYTVEHPQTVLVDPIDKVANVINRVATLKARAETNVFFSGSSTYSRRGLLRFPPPSLLEGYTAKLEAGAPYTHAKFDDIIRKREGPANQRIMEMVFLSKASPAMATIPDHGGTTMSTP